MNRAKSGKKKQRDLLHTLCQRTTTTYSGILFITANSVVFYTLLYAVPCSNSISQPILSSSINTFDAYARSDALF
jgi:hypothetical protein